MTTNSRTKADARVQVGDHLLFWIGGSGYKAFGVVSEPSRRPRGKAEAPWAGGTFAFRSVIPFTLQVEVERPIWFGFTKSVQIETNISASRFRQGMADLTDAEANRITVRLLEQSLSQIGE